MTEEQQIEEILWEAHSYGIREEVMALAKEKLASNPKLDRTQAYEQSFIDLKN
jgi:hypothetical protein